MSVNINIKDYNYELPDSRIAKYPLEERDQSKLLEFRDSCITEHIFRDLPGLLPDNAIMVFNDTKVVPARLHFRRESGASIEVFCLEPHLPVEYNVNFASTGQCEWRCIVGNVKKWKGDVLRLDNPDADEAVSLMNLRAELVERQGETSIVRFSWDNGVAFSAVLEACGRIPIPPYLNRDTESIDSERYQTLYAKYRGSVAAPTAGLHFTEEVLEAIRSKGIHTDNVCLHVGAGTFLPVKSSLVSEHDMHREPFSVNLSLLRLLLERKGKVVAVGTTSVRTLESLYYVGAELLESGTLCDVRQWAPYEKEYGYSTNEALQAIVDYLEKNGLEKLTVGTRIIIVPGFKFRIVDMMVTNFHQPQSTLLLLISAFVGGDWKTIYNFALDEGFRFLSYGDSSLLYKHYE